MRDSTRKAPDLPLSPAKVYEVVVDSLPVGFSLVDGEGIIREFNRAAEEITGYAREEVLGTSHLMIIHGSEDSEACPLFTHAFEQQTYTIATETRIRDRHGKSLTLAVTSAPLFDDSGGFVGGVELFRDITPLKRIERERRNFLAMIAHDMKNPVVAAAGFLYRLASEKAGPTTEKQRSYLDLITAEVDKLQNLVSSLSEFSRHEAGAYQPERIPYDLGKALQQRVEMARAQAESRQLEVDLVVPEKGVPTVMADPNMIDRVISNLLDNAVKYTPSGGSVTVAAHETGEGVVIEVSDNGVGIPPEDLPYLFEAFHRVKREPEEEKPEGTGLGLYICRKIVEAHGGTITAESRPGRGATFRFSLPKGPG